MDTLARLGGDEFVILLEEIANAENAAKVALDLITQLGNPFSITNASDVQIGASIGIALFPVDGTHAATLITHADEALYVAKANGRSKYRFFSNAQAPRK
jgi:diguanylate cyclase (GGDEF)-like protein